MKKTLGLLALLLISTLFIKTVSADQLDDVQNQIKKKNSEYTSAQRALAQIQKDLASIGGALQGTQSQLDSANTQIDSAKDELKKIEKTILSKQKSLDYLTKVRNQQIRSIYTHPQLSGLELIFSSGNLSRLPEIGVYQSKVVGDSQGMIKLVNRELADFKKTQTEIVKAKTDLESLASQISSKLAALEGSYYSTASVQNSLNNQVKQIRRTLTNLNKQQKELIAAKYGITSSPIGSVPPTGDPNSQKNFNPPFRPAFAIFSFGAYTHRNGMSQYGALGRASKGQSAQQILKAYYPGTTLNKSYPVPATIKVNGTNEYGQTFNNVTYTFDEYLMRLYEVPSYWNDLYAGKGKQVLRAQAVAARSYAIRYGSPICPSQSCQVVKKEKNSAAWQQAVKDTKNWVLTGGSGSFQYSSTSGGYLNTSGWDTTCHGFSCWLSGGAYEAIGGSPWFYKGWYKDLNGARCGRSHPWLTKAEFTDLLNSWVVYTKGSGSDQARVISIDYKSCWGGTASPYSLSQMKTRAGQLGGSYTSVSTASVTYSGSGFTSKAKFVTNRGYLEIDGQVFSDILNLRLPGKLAVKTPLYNIESRF
ncbi:MAG: SpoIID/LytB domain-containing protein [bacterium]|nr:SpoIID/LytB domain-containing protein [bacterium]